MIRITRYVSSGSQGAQQVWQTVSSQPSWVSRVALLAFFLVIGLPILLLVLLAVFAAVVMFSILALANAAVMWVKGRLPQRDSGRENVRVIRRM